MKAKKSPEQWPLTKINARIEELYKEMRGLSFSLLELNIKQYDGAISKTDAYDALYSLANKQIDLEEELFKLEKIVAERKAGKATENENGLS